MKKKNLRILLSSALIAALTGCIDINDDNDNNDNNGGDNTNPVKTFTDLNIDATSYDEFTYINLQSGETVSASDTWHLKAQRYSIVVNPDIAKAALADTQSEYYDSDGEAIDTAFINATAADEAASLYAITDDSELNYVSDTFRPAFIIALT